MRTIATESFTTKELLLLFPWTMSHGKTIYSISILNANGSTLPMELHGSDGGGLRLSRRRVFRASLLSPVVSKTIIGMVDKLFPMKMDAFHRLLDGPPDGTSLNVYQMTSCPIQILLLIVFTALATLYGSLAPVATTVALTYLGILMAMVCYQTNFAGSGITFYLLLSRLWKRMLLFSWIGHWTLLYGHIRALLLSC